MARGIKGHSPTVKPSTKAVSGSFMGTAIPPQLGRVVKPVEKEHFGKVKKIDKVRFS